MKKPWFLLIVVMLMTSCIGIESTIRIHNNGSGEITLTYTVSQYVLNLGRADTDEPFLPLPVGKEDFENSVQSIQGLKLLSWKKVKEDEENIVISAHLKFNSIKALSSFFGTSGNLKVSLERQGDLSIYKQVITIPEEEGETSEESLALLDTFFKDYELTFTLQTDREIEFANIGEINGRKARFSLGVDQLFHASAPIIWEVRW